MDKCLSFEVCIRCSKQYLTCCQDCRVPFSWDDIQRIISFGYQPEEFLVAGEYSRDGFIDADEPWWLDSMINVDERLFKLNVKRDAGKCPFLVMGSGCLLGEHRPAVCKIYPFWMVGSYVVYEQDGDDDPCPLCSLPMDETLALLCETRDSIRGYFDEIRHDCIHRKQEHRGMIERLISSGNVMLVG